MLYLVFFSFSLLTFLWLPTILIFIIHSFILFPFSWIVFNCNSYSHKDVFFSFVLGFPFHFIPVFLGMPPFVLLASSPSLLVLWWLIDWYLTSSCPLNPQPICPLFSSLPLFLPFDSALLSYRLTLPAFLHFFTILPYTRPTLFTISTPETSFITWCIRWSVNTNYLEIECVYFGFGAKYYMRFDMTSPSNRMIR